MIVKPFADINATPPEAIRAADPEVWRWLYELATKLQQFEYEIPDEEP